MARLFGIAGGLVVVTAVLLINGGYVYKTTCPNTRGSKTTSWAYGISDVLPYTRSTSPPCYSHTATRLLLSSMGIAPLGASKAASSGVPTSLRELSALKSQMDTLDRRVTAVKPTTPLTASSLRQYTVQLAPLISAYHQFALKVRADRKALGAISDPDIRQGWSYLVTRSMVGYQGLDQMSADLVAGNYPQFVKRVKSSQARVTKLDERWTTIAVVLNARYSG